MSDTTCTPCLQGRHVRCGGDCACSICRNRPLRRAVRPAEPVPARKPKNPPRKREKPRERPPAPRAKEPWFPPRPANPNKLEKSRTEKWMRPLIGPPRQVAAIMFRLGANEYEVAEKLNCSPAAAREVRDNHESPIQP